MGCINSRIKIHIINNKNYNNDINNNYKIINHLIDNEIIIENNNNIVNNINSNNNSTNLILSSNNNSANNTHNKISDEVEEDADTQSRGPKWRRVLSTAEARKKYESDGSLPKRAPFTLLELRGFLDDPLLMKHVGLFGKTRKSFDCFMCWVDINEFKNIGHDAEHYRRSKASHIYKKYIKEGAILRVKFITSEISNNIESQINIANTNRTEIPINLFDLIQQQCLKFIFTDIFQPFKYSTYYNDIMTNMNENYNKIQPDDFEYIEVLGQGGFGLVVHCKKKSTNKHYALKIQTKMGLLRTFKNVLYRVDYEKQALAACNHPCIVALDYAFQTNTLVFLAMQLGTGGTLHDALSLCENGMMDEERVRFYTTEIVLALGHIHSLGMIYRDLKPQNVLLNLDGHIQLVDLGGIIDPSGHVLGFQDESEQMLNGLFVKDYANVRLKNQLHKEKMKKKKEKQIENEKKKKLLIDNNNNNNNNIPLNNIIKDLLTEDLETKKFETIDDHLDDLNNDELINESIDKENKENKEKKENKENKEIIKEKNIDNNNNNDDIDEDEDDDIDDFDSEFLNDDNNDLYDLNSSKEPIKRARSIMGTDGYMALEIMKLKIQKIEDRKGYTNAVDWWSLGVLMYVLLCGEKPYPLLNQTTLPELIISLENDPLYKISVKEWLQKIILYGIDNIDIPKEYLSIYTKLNGIKKVSPYMTEIIMMFLDFNENTRLGSILSGGIKIIKEQPIFRYSCISSQNALNFYTVPMDDIFINHNLLNEAINNNSHNNSHNNSDPAGLNTMNNSFELRDTILKQNTLNNIEDSSDRKISPTHKSEFCWELFELKQIIPPFIPEPHQIAEEIKYESFESMMILLDKSTWLKQYPSSYYDEYFQNWDFISPHILKMEYGIANVLEQYETKYKARKFFGEINDDITKYRNGGGNGGGSGGIIGGTKVEKRKGSQKGLLGVIGVS